MGVQDVHLQAHVGGAFQRASREEGEAAVVVAEVLVRHAVQTVPVEEPRDVEEPEPGAPVFDFTHRPGGRARPSGRVETRDDPALLDAPVAGGHDGHLVAQPREGDRQGASYVPEATGLRVRGDLGHDHQNAESGHGGIV